MKQLMFIQALAESTKPGVSNQHLCVCMPYANHYAAEQCGLTKSHKLARTTRQMYPSPRMEYSSMCALIVSLGNLLIKRSSLSSDKEMLIPDNRRE
jgi:hypothetical protein